MSQAVYPVFSWHEFPIAKSSFTRNLARSSPKVAGLFDFDDTKGLWDMCGQNSKPVPIIKDWHRETKEIHISVAGTQFWSNLMSLANDATFRDVLSTDTHPTTKAHHTTAYSRVDNHFKPTLIVLWYIVRLVKVKPELFGDSTIEPLSLACKDVFKGWKFLAWTHKTPSRKVFWKKMPKKVISIKPKWRSDSPSKSLGDPGGATGEETAMDDEGDSDDGSAIDDEHDTYVDDASTGEDATQGTTSQGYAADGQGPSPEGLNNEHETSPSQLDSRAKESEQEAESQEAQPAQSTNPLDPTTNSDENLDFDGANEAWKLMKEEIG